MLCFNCYANIGTNKITSQVKDPLLDDDVRSLKILTSTLHSHWHVETVFYLLIYFFVSDEVVMPVHDDATVWVI